MPLYNLLDAMSPTRSLGRALLPSTNPQQIPLPEPLPPEQDLRSINDAAPVPWEQQETILQSALRSGMGGLQYVGETLDKPGRAVRGVLTGNLGEVANLIPFSDSMGITDPAASISGRNMLEKYGMLGENTDGIDAGDVAGFGVELLTDPLSWLSFGAAGAAASAMKGAGKLGGRMAIAATEHADDIAKGVKGLMNVHTPDLTIPFTNWGIKAKPLHQTKLGERLGLTTSNIGVGETAANVYKNLWYNKYSPVPYVRKVFSGVPGVGDLSSPIRFQEKFDLAYADDVRETADVAGRAVELMGKQQELSGQFGSLIDNTFYGGPENLQKMRVGAVLDATATSARLRREVDKALRQAGKDPESVFAMQQKMKANPDSFDPTDFSNEAAYMDDPAVSGRLEAIYHNAMSGMAGLGDSAAEMKAGFDKVRAAYAEAQGLVAPTDTMFDDSIRAFLEQKDPLTGQHIVDRLQKIGIDKNLTEYDEAIDSFYKLGNELREMFPRVREELTMYGLDIPRLTDHYIEYAHRRGGRDVQSSIEDMLHAKRKQFKTSGYDFQEARNDLLRNWEGGTETINNASRDAAISAAKHDKKRAGELLDEQLGTAPDYDEVGAPAQGAKGRILYDAARTNNTSYIRARELANMDVAARNATVKQARATATALDEFYGSGWYKAGHNFVTRFGEDVARAARGEGAVDGIHAFGDAMKKTGLNEKELLQFMSRAIDPSQAAAMFRKANVDDADVIEQAIAKTKRAYTPEGLEERIVGGVADDDLVRLTPEELTAVQNVGKMKPGWSMQKAGYLLAKKYGIPAYWNYDALARKALAASNDEALSKLAKSDLGTHEFKGALLEELQARQRALPPEEQWAAGFHKGYGNRLPSGPTGDVEDLFASAPGTTDLGDIDDFMGELRQRMPEVRDMPLMGQNDIDQLVAYLYHMPKEVLQTGLFNRGTVNDAVEYMLQATRAKVAMKTVHRVLQDSEMVSESIADGDSLIKFWSGAGLKNEGLINAMAKRSGMDDASIMAMLKDASPEAVAKRDELLKMADKLKIDPGVGKALVNYSKTLQAGISDSSTVGKAMDLFNGTMKGMLTSPYPAFHTRNRFSGMMANWLAGITDNRAEKEAHNLFFGLNWDESIKAADGSDVALKDILREVLAMNIVQQGGGGAHAHVMRQVEVLARAANAAPEAKTFTNNRALRPWEFTLRGPFGEVVDTFKAARAEGGLREGLKQAAFGGKGPDGEDRTGLFNVWSFVGGFDPLRGRARNGELDPIGKPLDWFARNKSDVTNNAFMKAGENGNAYVEFMNRVAPYIALRKAGWTPATAAMKVKEVQFDYKQLSEFEKKVMKRGMLFYSFMRKNLELQTKMLLQNPGGRSSQMIRLIDNLREEGPGEEGYVPKYLAESFAMKVPSSGLPQGTQRFWSQSGLFPFEEAFNRFVFDNKGFPLDVRRTSEKFLASTTPPLQAAAEQISGRQLWSGRNLKDLYSWPTGDENLDFWISKAPTARLHTMIRQWTDPRKAVWQNAINSLFGGVRITDVDTAKYRIYDARDALHQDLLGDRDIGQFATLYPKDIGSLLDRAAIGDNEALQKLQVYNNLRRGVRDLNERRATTGADAK